jgi:hypothetical protein
MSGNRFDFQNMLGALYSSENGILTNNGKNSISGQLPRQLCESGFGQNSIIADPLFINVAEGDLRLSSDSPALKMGFQPVPLKRMCLRRSTTCKLATHETNEMTINQKTLHCYTH